MFKLDEAAINEQFGRMIDTISPHIALRSADFPVLGQLTLLRLPGLKLLPLLGYEEIELCAKTIFSHKLLKQGSEDAIRLVVQQFLDAMVRGIIERRHSIGYRLTVGPLMFEYTEDVAVDYTENQLAYGIEVVAVVLIEWSFLR